jgi:hypothetical protein
MIDRRYTHPQIFDRSRVEKLAKALGVKVGRLLE